MIRPPSHDFPPYATRCTRCGLELLYVADIGAPACVSDAVADADAEKRALAAIAARLMRRR